jgi:hypothetical protein
MKGHGREIIQLGLPITEGPPEDEHLRGTSSQVVNIYSIVNS